jgi:hypothetical protein
MNIPSMGSVIVVMLIIAAVLGWAFIELVIWLFSFVDISLAKGGAE